MHSPKITHSLRGYQTYLANQNQWREDAVSSFRQGERNLHWWSLGDEALGSQRMRFLTVVGGGGLKKL